MVQVRTVRRSVARRGAMLVLGALILAACGDDATTATTVATTASTTTASTTTASTIKASTTTAAAPTTTAAAVSGGGTSAALALKVGTTSLGPVLVDGAGHTLYVFTKDETNKSNCTAACFNAWPPLYGVPRVGAGVDAAKLGSFTTADGKTQATIGGMPLYYFAADSAVGDTKGQNVGGVWFVVDATGAMKK